jgi:hypothetical protein
LWKEAKPEENSWTAFSTGFPLFTATHSISKVMSQRNALLKYFALNHVLIPIHSIYNEQLNGFGAYIFRKGKFHPYLQTRIIKP